MTWRTLSISLLKEEEKLSDVVEVVSSRLSKQVLDHYGDFVQGMNNITELTNNLEQSFVVVTNGRAVQVDPWLTPALPRLVSALEPDV
jgi:hypothetical protein